MGCCLSCKSSNKLKSIRVVHFNGHVEDFDYPISAGQITGKPHSSKHFVSTAAQLLSNASSKSLKPDTQLQQGQIYFLLPYSTLQAEVSPLDFVALVRRLTSVAQKSSRHQMVQPVTSPDRVVQPMVQPGGVGFVNKRCNGGKPWKPLLDTIREKSFNRRSESDIIMQEMQSEMQDQK